MHRHEISAESFVNISCAHTYCNTIALLSLTSVPQQMTRPISWLGARPNSVDVLINVGYQAISLGLEHACSSWGTSNFQSDLYNLHVPHSHVWCRESRGKPPSTPLTLSSLWMPLLEPTARPVPWMSNYDLVSWWFHQVFAREGQVATPTDLFDISAQPDFLIVAGVYHLQRTFCFISEDTPELGACLSMIGAGALNILFADQCALCGCRRSHPDTSRCTHCSRSKYLSDPDRSENNEGAVRARRARKIRGELVHRIGKTSGDQRETLARAVASIIYSMPSSNSVYLSWLKKVTAALRRAPLVTDNFPKNFAEIGFKSQLKALREKIDPNEWDYAIWPQKIEWTQSWLEQLAIIKGRRRGPGPMDITLQRAAQAKELLQAGQSKSSVAHALGVSLSHLSHILRRTQCVGRR